MRDANLRAEPASREERPLREVEGERKPVETNLPNALATHVWLGATSAERLAAIRTAVVFFVSIGALVGSFFLYRGFLLEVVASPISWGQSQAADRNIAKSKEQAHVEPRRWPGSSLAWAASLGFVALVFAVTVVALGASGTLSRMGHEPE